MPHRNVKQAIKAAIEQWQTRIRFLVRNPDFRKDLMEVRKVHSTDPRWETYFAFLRKWGLQWFPSELIIKGEWPSTPKGYETAIFKAMQETGLDPSAREEDGLISLPPVVGREPYDEYVRANYDPEDEEPIQVPDHIPRPGTILNLRVDLGYPQDVLEAIIKVELGQAKHRRKELQERGVLSPAPQRLRLDKVDFYLQVYDRAAGGEPYREIARALGSRKSTVQCAHVKAISLIGGARPVRRAPQRPSRARRQSIRRRAVTRHADPVRWIQQHLKNCTICKDAEHWDQQCNGFKSFVTSNFGLDFVPFEGMTSDGTSVEAAEPQEDETENDEPEEN